MGVCPLQVKLLIHNLLSKKAPPFFKEERMSAGGINCFMNIITGMAPGLV
jgi:hypothetical protein